VLSEAKALREGTEDVDSVARAADPLCEARDRRVGKRSAEERGQVAELPLDLGRKGAGLSVGEQPDGLAPRRRARWAAPQHEIPWRVGVVGDGLAATRTDGERRQQAGAAARAVADS
jgi:hypothetical protein